VSERRSVQEIHTYVGQIVALFPLLECAQCAVAVMQWLDRSNIEYQLLRLKPKVMSDLFELLNQIKVSPGLYLGRPAVTDLFIF
jgi:Papain fold toxin 2